MNVLCFIYLSERTLTGLAQNTSILPMLYTFLFCLIEYGLSRFFNFNIFDFLVLYFFIQNKEAVDGLGITENMTRVNEIAKHNIQ